ncbi:hypothetical protein PTTG_04915 [Puccinia triticina 1-1 BBBD Race 1]|uniref:Uncharacterized protein n=1 Tax=Puccinia triticina (isolate 1-1 / race 1 (BBBD)) TaxID=630390 RepID=A0A0C4EVS9_PUCT1|nr:hypothetical protein PTTG_04915 [Puccinia triticina 1-1 BBBD Race 1]
MYQICENRCAMAGKLYPKNHQLAVVLAVKDTHSNIEEGASASVQPTRILPVWQSDSLTTILHGLDKMVLAQAQHHKTKSVNDNVYGCFKSSHGHTKGINGVPRNLHTNCYSNAWRNWLCKFKQDTVSQVPPFNIEDLAKGMESLVTLNPQSGPGPTGSAPNLAPAPQASPANPQTGGQPGPSGTISMHVD